MVIWLIIISQIFAGLLPLSVRAHAYYTPYTQWQTEEFPLMLGTGVENKNNNKNPTTFKTTTMIIIFV